MVSSTPAVVSSVIAPPQQPSTVVRTPSRVVPPVTSQESNVTGHSTVPAGQDTSQHAPQAGSSWLDRANKALPDTGDAIMLGLVVLGIILLIVAGILVYRQRK